MHPDLEEAADDAGLVEGRVIVDTGIVERVERRICVEHVQYISKDRDSFIDFVADAQIDIDEVIRGAIERYRKTGVDTRLETTSL